MTARYTARCLPAVSGRMRQPDTYRTMATSMRVCVRVCVYVYTYTMCVVTCRDALRVMCAHTCVRVSYERQCDDACVVHYTGDNVNNVYTYTHKT